MSHTGSSTLDRGTLAQATFRIIMAALARPGSVHELALLHPVDHRVLGALYPTSAALLLALADFETSVWLDTSLAEAEAVRLLKFETGARIVSTHEEADFAIAEATPSMPSLSSFKSGTPEYPDRSALVVVQVREVRDDGARQGLSFAGPGIVDRIMLDIEPCPPAFAEQWQLNRAGFPCGVDIVFASPTRIVALPRSARLITES